MSGYCHDTVVCLSVCRSVCRSVHVMLCIVVLRVAVGGRKLYRRVPRKGLPIHFSRHFCCRLYRLATIHSDKPKYRNFRVWNSHGQRGHMTVAFRRFGSAVHIRSAFLATATLLEFTHTDKTKSLAK